MGRAPCCEKVGLKKGPWTPEEDQKLVTYIHEHGHGSWRALPQKAGLLRCGKSCRLRWANYLRPDIKRGKFSVQEEQTIIQLHALLGNRWSAIATHLPKRTDNEIKNYWNTHLKKRLIQMGIDPVTHKPQSKSTSSSALVSHMAQWESARLEAETRLVRESKLRANANFNLNLNALNPLPRPWRSSSSSSGHGFESPSSPAALGLSSYSFDWMKAIEKFDKVACNWANDAETPSHTETSYVGLLQQAMCPSSQTTKVLSDETKKILASPKIQDLSVNTDSSEDKKPNLENAQSADRDNTVLGNCSSARSDVSELSKTDNGDGDESCALKGFQQHLRSCSDEISSNAPTYDGLSTDMLMDLVIVPTSCSADERSLSGGLCTPSADDNKDYWSNMFIVCNSPQTHTNHSGVQSLF